MAVVALAAMRAFHHGLFLLKHQQHCLGNRAFAHLDYFVNVFANDGTGAFAHRGSFKAPGINGKIIASDLDDDGALDFAGRQLVRRSEFNCASSFNDPEPPRACRHLEAAFANEVTGLARGGFRTPGLRNLSSTAPYFHDGRFASLEEVLAYYRTPPDKAVIFHELPRALDLSDAELADLASFLRALDPN